MSRVLRTIKCRQLLVALLAVIATTYVFSGSEARQRVKSLFRKHMEALSPSDMKKLAKESQMIAEVQQEEAAVKAGTPDLSPVDTDSKNIISQIIRNYSCCQ